MTVFSLIFVHFSYTLSNQYSTFFVYPRIYRESEKWSYRIFRIERTSSRLQVHVSLELCTSLWQFPFQTPFDKTFIKRHLKAIKEKNIFTIKQKHPSNRRGLFFMLRSSVFHHSSFIHLLAATNAQCTQEKLALPNDVEKIFQKSTFFINIH